MTSKTTESVKVVIRTRPMSQKEIDKGCQRIAQCDTQQQQVNLFKPGDNLPRTFTFDAVFGEDSTQQQVYDDCGFSLVESVLEGYNGTMFAYGQTGCGKTHTMMGPTSSFENQNFDESQRGIIPKALRHIFGCIDAAERDKKFLVRVSYLEIYNEQILDLLSKNHTQNLSIKEDPNKGIYVKDLTTVIVKSVAEIEKILFAGMKNRKTGETAMNKDSSRSHSIFTIYIETAENSNDGTGKQKIKAGKLNLVDLAGSERQSKTQAVGVRLEEAKSINLSLSALGNVIKALVDGVSTHIPYRDSKLTRLLQDSLGGNTKTVMIAALSPADYNYDETLSTLRYADRAKSIKNKPRINEDPKDALLKEYEQEIKQLREMLAQLQNQGASNQQMNQVLNNLQKSMKAQTINMHIEENVDDLIRKLEGQGKKVKIIEDDEEDINQRQDDEQRGDGQEEALRKQSTLLEQKLKEFERLEQEKQDLNADKERIATELQLKETKLRIEQQEKQKLENFIKDMEMKLVQGGQVLEEKEKEKNKVYREYQLKLKKQKKKEKQLQEEKRLKEEEILNVNRQYKDLQEEVQENRVIIEKLKCKYQKALNEVKDLEKEQQGDREELLETIRQQQYDLKFFRKIVKMLMKDEEIAKLKIKSQYDDNQNDWQIPPFILKAKEVTLPALKKNAYDVMEQEKENRDLAIDGDSDDEQGDNLRTNTSFSKPPLSKSYQSEQNGIPKTPIKRVQSRGRVQINAVQKQTTRQDLSIQNNMRRSQIEERNSYNNSSQQLLMSPNSSIRSKNSKAMAQLAPLEKISAQMISPPSIEQLLNGGRREVNIPSIEYLQQLNKLQPLNHKPKKK